MGRRPELVGGGSIRSLGGWDEIKKLRHSGQDRIKDRLAILLQPVFVFMGILRAQIDNFS
jgi:putative transposase